MTNPNLLGPVILVSLTSQFHLLQPQNHLTIRPDEYLPKHPVSESHYKKERLYGLL